MDILLQLFEIIVGFILGFSTLILFPCYIANMMSSEKKDMRKMGEFLMIVFCLGMLFFLMKHIENDPGPADPPEKQEQSQKLAAK